jgi:8-hydroxy-5-deazaflavin:NADPH oxidoreductase
MVPQQADGSFALSIKTMYTKQTIAFIGVTGKSGSAILKNIAADNYRLVFASESSDQLQPLMNEIKAQHPSADVEITDCSFNACWEADIIFAAIPAEAFQLFANKIKVVANRKIVISIADQMGNDSFRNADLKSQLPNTNIATIYSAAFVSSFLRAGAAGTGNKEVLISGDEEALEATSAVIIAAGYIPVITNDFVEL